MDRSTIITYIINKLNTTIKEFPTANIDQPGDIQTFKIAKCINDENGNSLLNKDHYYIITNTLKSQYKLENVKCYYPKRFFSQMEEINIVYNGYNYQPLN